MLDISEDSREEPNSKVAVLLKDARQQLVDTGTRNRLVHVNRSASRANVLNIINERSDDIFEILKTKSRKMRLKATGKDKVKLDEDAPVLIEEPVLKEPFDETRYTDNQLETLLGPDAQQKRLLRLASEARTAEEEQGINILYLSLGFLTWFEDKSSAVKREAPLILLPVELTRNAKTSTYDITCRDDDIVTNLSLQERLKSDFGIELPEIDVDEEGWSPNFYFEKVRSVIEGKPQWSIDENGMQLGFFSFAKLLMLHDLDPENWPSGGLESKPLVDGLLASGFQSDDPLFNKEDRLDEKLSPVDIIQVVDADASQTKVIEEVRSGRDLVVQGPPGTGKSQTIANIIAAAVHDGKTVLFVAEKMAALSVVHNRLKSTGLGSICLELHSRAANKKQVVAELARMLSAGNIVPAMPESPQKLTSIRNGLNEVASVLHSDVSGIGETPFKIISELVRLAGKNTPPPKIDGTMLAKFSSLQTSEIEKLIDDYCRQLGDVKDRTAHPFYGVNNLELQPLDVQRLTTTISELQEKTSSFAKNATQAVELTKFSDPNFNEIYKAVDFFQTVSTAPEFAPNLVPLFQDENSASNLRTALQIGQEWQDVFQAGVSKYVEAVWTLPVDHLRGPIASAVGSFFAKFGGAYRSASRELATLLQVPIPKSAEERLSLVDELLAAQSKRKHFEEHESYLKQALGSIWYGERTQFAKVLAVGDWYQEVYQKQPEVSVQTIAGLAGKRETTKKMAQFLRGNTEIIYTAATDIFNKLHLNIEQAFARPSLEDVPLDALALKLQKIAENHMKYGDWVKLALTIKKLETAKLGNVITRIDNGELLPTSAKAEIQYARAEMLWKNTLEKQPKLNQIANLSRHELVEQFRQLEQQRINDVKTIIRAKHLAQLPSGSIGEMGIIRGEIGKKRALKPVRKLMEAAGSMIQRIKPVLLMSPISIAQFLPPETVEFDLLVIDEASQIRPEDALGAIARSKQIVVVGDQKQLPPTSFFSRVTGGDEEFEDEDDVLDGMARATEMESILSLCEARSIPSRMLEWHYRSRDPSLIRVSNTEFYDSNLVLPPSPLENDEEYGLKLTRVNGAYSSKSRGDGSPATNKIEAQAVVAEIAQHARNNPDMSLGVVTFSVTQRNMVTEILEFERRSDHILDSFLREGRSEDVFVKNIENVQGDERDVILISIGYGPHEPGGRLASMSFGPVNSDGGGRRLNVLFSRARIKCQIFCSFDPGDIDLARTQKEGPRILKRFLEFAKTGIMDQALPSGGEADSPFEYDVANEIRKLGYVVDHQIGSAGFLIDLGVKHPIRIGQYMLAVECDGATYHSALWARERDRLRQEVLENLGWQFHRIWSTDWFYRRQKEIQRLETVLKNASTLLENGVVVNGANTGDDLRVAKQDENKNLPTIEVLELPTMTCPPYEKADFSIQSSAEPHEVPLSRLMEIVQRIVGIEGPIHEDELARRLAFVFGKEKAGRRIIEATNKALQKAKQSTSDERLLNDGAFWFNVSQHEDIPVRNRSNQIPSIQKAEMIPPMEIKAAIKMIVKQSGDAQEDEITRAVAKLFGFERVGPTLNAVISKEFSVA